MGYHVYVIRQYDDLKEDYPERNEEARLLLCFGAAGGSFLFILRNPGKMH